MWTSDSLSRSMSQYSTIAAAMAGPWTKALLSARRPLCVAMVSLRGAESMSSCAMDRCVPPWAYLASTVDVLAPSPANPTQRLYRCVPQTVSHIVQQTARSAGKPGLWAPIDQAQHLPSPAQSCSRPHCLPCLTCAREAQAHQRRVRQAALLPPSPRLGQRAMDCGTTWTYLTTPAAM